MFKEIIDITHTITNDIPTFHAPWHTNVSITTMGTIDTVGRETKKVVIGTHTGTHMDAPLHFIKNGNTLDKISVEKMIGPVDIIDFSYLEENHCITLDEIKKAEIKNNKVIFYYNWSRFWNDKKLFYKNYPYLSAEAVNYLIEKNVELIGMDTPSPDDSRTKLLSENDSLIHKLLLKNNILIVEYLNLDNVKDFNNWNIIALPIKIENADGSPARVCLAR